MNKRDDRLVVEFDKEDVIILIEWKRLCLGKYGIGGMKKRTAEIIREDLKKLKNDKLHI